MKIIGVGRQCRVRRHRNGILLAATAASALCLATQARAQNAAEEEPETASEAAQSASTHDGSGEQVMLDENGNVIVVRGIRQTIQNSIADKRNATTITDVVTADEIGNLPALSIGEVLETITGAGANRSRVGATEFAIRGLGPFFGASVFNGREASNGSGDRSVNFSQFPSELINTVRVYKSQQANLVEGGISGVVELETLRPLDLRGRRIQVEAKGNYNSRQSGLANGDDLGWRATASYVDQFDVGDGGEFGISLGGQISETNNPSDTYGASTNWIACNDSVDSAGVCPQVTRQQVADGTPFYVLPTSRLFRQTEADDTRKSIFAALQYRPNDAWDINFDVEWSDVSYGEIRHDFALAETYAAITNRVVADNGALLAYDGISTMQTSSDNFYRKENYSGGGLNVAWDATDRLRLIADASYSRTRRDDLDLIARYRTDPFDIYGEVVPYANQRVAYSYDATGGGVPAFTFDPLFDINDHALFSDDLALQRRKREAINTIKAGRLDAEFETGGGALTGLKAGARYSQLQYRWLEDSFTYTQGDRDLDRQVNEACRIEFPQSDFLSTSDTNTVTSWATFDPLCQFEMYLGAADPGGDGDLRDTGNADVTEKTLGLYAMAEFDTMLGAIPVRGNFGLRYVDTRVKSIGLRSAFTVIDNGDGTIRLEELPGEFASETLRHSYSAFLPSANIIFDLREDVLLRAAVYRAMVRADPSDLAAGRDLAVDVGDVTNAADAISSITAKGNPSLNPLYAWNFDASLEYYPNPDSVFAAAAYYKIFQGSTAPVDVEESFVVDGVTFVVPVTVSQSSSDTSHLLGLEFTGQYRFSFLPAPLDGLSAKLSYNYTETNYVTEDIALGELVTSDGEVEPGIIDPVSLNGQSDHVLSASLLYQLGGLEIQGIYKYRSPYFQKFVGGGRQNRIVRAADVFDLRVNYTVSRNLRLSFEALNLTNEPRISDMPIPGSMQGYEVYGTSFFAGARVSF